MKRATLLILCLLCAVALAATVTAPTKKWSIAWRFKTGKAIIAAPLVEGDVAYVSSQDGFVYALDVKTGKRKWSTKLGSAVETTPVVSGDRLCVSTNDGRLICLAIKTGKQLWQYKAGDAINRPLVFTLKPNTPLLLASCYDATLYCLSMEGKLVWKAKASDWINAPAVICDHQAAFGSCDGKVYFVRLCDGKQLAAVDLKDYIPTSPVAGKDGFYVATAGGEVSKIDSKTHKIAWTAKPDKKVAAKLGSVFATPILLDKRLIVSDDKGNLRALDATNGNLLWTAKVRGGVTQSPRLVGCDLIVSTNQGRLYAINPVDGKTLWTYRLGGGELTAVCPAGETLLMGTSTGWVYCIKPKQPAPTAKEKP
jgi:outer membrane protein assembly factor BamB